MWVLIGMVVLIGTGSFLFHTYATVWSGFMDTVPIWVFVATFVLVGMHRIGGVPPGRIAMIVVGAVALLTILFLATGDGSAGNGQAAPDPLNGSGQYAPALAALFFFAVMSWWRQHPFRNWVAGAAVVFSASLVFRTLDMHVCDSFPIGTHFVWHCLNGLMIALLLQMIVRIPAKAR